jgi:integrase
MFPDSIGGSRDPSNTSRALREARDSDEFAWVTSHVFRKTCATILDESALSAREIADQLGGREGVAGSGPPPRPAD